MINILEIIKIQGYELTIYGTKDDPLFLAVDVAKMIDYSVGRTSEMISRIDEDEKLLSVISRSGQNRQMWLLTEYVRK